MLRTALRRQCAILAGSSARGTSHRTRSTAEFQSLFRLSSQILAHDNVEQKVCGMSFDFSCIEKQPLALRLARPFSGVGNKQTRLIIYRFPRFKLSIGNGLPQTCPWGLRNMDMFPITPADHPSLCYLIYKRYDRTATSTRFWYNVTGRVISMPFLCLPMRYLL